MEAQIATLLSSTYSISNNTDIKNAESMLFQSITHPNFFPSLFNIILDSSNPIQLRISGILFLNASMRLLWNQNNSPFTIEVRKYIFQFIPQLLKNSPLQMIRTCSHLAFDIINRTYLTYEWPEIYSEIINGFSGENENNDNLILCSLILSNSLFSVFLLTNKQFENKINEDLNNANQNLIQFIIQSLIQFITSIFLQKSTNILLITYCYRLINKLFKFDINLLNQIFGSNDLLASLTQEMIMHSFQIKNISPNDPSFEQFLKKTMKFLTTCYSNPILSNFINIGFISEFLPTIQEILKSVLSNSIKCSTLQFLSQIFINEIVWQTAGESNAANTLVNIIFPLFAISNDDFEMAYTDPSGFISENQKMCEDFNDLKASSGYILNNSAKRHEIIISICISNVINTFQMFASNQTDHLNLFSAFHMCSSVINLAAKKNNDSVISLFQSIAPLFQISDNQSNQFATAASFLLLASCPNLKYSNDLIKIVFIHIDNPFNLIRYFAIECISSILRQVSASQNPSLKEELFNQFGQKLEQSFQLLLSVSREASNAYLILSFNHFFSLFGERLLPFSQSLADNFLGIINDVTRNNSGNDDSEKFSTLIMVIDSFSSLIKIISKSNQISNQLLPSIYHSLVQLFPNIPINIYESYFPLFKQIVMDSPIFSPLYWEITQVFNSQISDLFNQLIELIQFKEIEMKNDGTAIEYMVNFINTTLLEVNDFEDFQNYCPSICGFLLQLRDVSAKLNNGAVFISIVQKVITQIQLLFNEEAAGNSDFNNNNIIKLLNSLLIVDAAFVINICNDIFPLVFTYWQNNLSFPLSVPAAYSILSLQQLDNEQKSVLLASVLNLTFNNLILKSSLMDNNIEEEDDFDDLDDFDDEVAEKCLWFSDQDAASLLLQIFGSNQQDTNLFSKCDPKQIEFLYEYQKKFMH